MTPEARFTKNCLQPWRLVNVFADGAIAPCCGFIEGDFGNVFHDSFGPLLSEGEDHLFANSAYRELRANLLEGTPGEICRTCRTVAEEDIPVEQLREKVEAHLRSHGLETVDRDLSTLSAFDDCLISITNRCNLSCVYCVHSAPANAERRSFFAAEMSPERLFELVGRLAEQGLKSLSFVGWGELTLYPGWKSICESLRLQFPNLKLGVVSNFSRPLTESEIETLLEFEHVCISCDTLDPDVFVMLRRGGKLSTVMGNIRRLKDAMEGRSNPPRVCLNVTESDVMIGQLGELGCFAARNGFSINLSNLHIVKDSEAERTGCIRRTLDLDNEAMPKIWETLRELPIRMKIENPAVDVWQIGPIYEQVKARALRQSKDLFVPSAEETLYSHFHQNLHRPDFAYLRRFHVSPSEIYKGIYLEESTQLELNAPFQSSRVMFRLHSVHERCDGNFELVPGALQESILEGRFTLAYRQSVRQSQKALLEVVSIEPCDDPTAISQLDVSADMDGPEPIFIRETLLTHDIERRIQHFVESQQPIGLYCAGARTQLLLESTSLGRCNIQFIVDGDPMRQGKYFCGYEVCPPERLRLFEGALFIIHATAPFRIERALRAAGVRNDLFLF